MTKDTGVTLFISHLACLGIGAMSATIIAVKYLPPPMVLFIGIANAIITFIISSLVFSAIDADSNDITLDPYEPYERGFDEDREYQRYVYRDVGSNDRDEG